MSVWTHVTGMIRVWTYNDNKKTVQKHIKKIKEILGPQDYDEPKNQEDIKLPEGSEGALEYSITEVNRKDYEDIYDKKTHKYTGKRKRVIKPDNIIINFFGDLRDMEMPPSRYEGMYDTTKDLEDWFRKTMEEIEKEIFYIDLRGSFLVYECEESNTAWLLHFVDGPGDNSPQVMVKTKIAKSNALRTPWREESEFKKLT